jgi:carbonic anhydrase
MYPHALGAVIVSSRSSFSGVTAAPKKDSACSYGQMNIPHTPNKFNALQYHIHIFSEHQIIGQGTNGYFPAELHVVHQEETEESYAVFGTMMDIGTEDHPVFEYFLQGWEAKAESIQRACAESTQSRFLRAMAETVDFVPVQQKVQCPVIGTIYSNATEPSFPEGESPDLYNLPDDKDFGTFTYKGGLTTPGCTEIVNWNLLDKAMTISESQMRRLEAVVMCYVAQVIDETDGSIKQCYYGTVADEAGSTSRPPQPLKGRKVTHRCRDGPAVKYVDVGELPLDEAVSTNPAPQSEPAKEETKEETKVKPGFIALFVIIGITVLVGAAFYLHKMQLDSQSNRYRELFAKRIAETIEFTGKHGQLTPESLEDAFRRMDIDGDGNVSKEEMRQFMGDKMSAKDFDVMFIAMDIDHRGTVEFAEFCSFMTHVFAT